MSFILCQDIFPASVHPDEAPLFSHRKEGDVEDKGMPSEREGEGGVLTGLGGPCQTPVAAPAAHPRISLRNGLLCESSTAVR